MDLQTLFRTLARNLGREGQTQANLSLAALALIDANNEIKIRGDDLPGTLTNLLGAGATSDANTTLRVNKFSYDVTGLQAAGAVSSHSFGFQLPPSAWLILAWVFSVGVTIAPNTGLSAATIGIADDDNAWTGSDLNIKNVSGNLKTNDTTGDVGSYPYILNGGSQIAGNVTLTGKTFAQLTAGQISLTLFYVPIP